MHLPETEISDVALHRPFGSKIKSLKIDKNRFSPDSET